jgi:hypothetical protein
MAKKNKPPFTLVDIPDEYSEPLNSLSLDLAGLLVSKKPLSLECWARMNRSICRIKKSSKGSSDK